MHLEAATGRRSIPAFIPTWNSSCSCPGTPAPFGPVPDRLGVVLVSAKAGLASILSLCGSGVFARLLHVGMVGRTRQTVHQAASLLLPRARQASKHAVYSLVPQLLQRCGNKPNTSTRKISTRNGQGASGRAGKDWAIPRLRLATSRKG